MALPQCFCWTRFGAEAGQPVEGILARKEQERVANGGFFIWGIGNAVGPSIRELLRQNSSPEVLFSPIKSAPKQKDVSPPAVAAWTSGETLEGCPYSLPQHSLVTSRYDPDAPRDGHYALVCFSRSPITHRQSGDRIEFDGLNNLLTGRRIGASQVTAVVRLDEARLESALTYEVAIRAELVYPYFIRLRNPIVLPDAAREKALGRDWIANAFRLVKEYRPDGLPQQLPLHA